MKEEREYTAVQAAARVRSKEPAARREKPAEDRQRRIFSEHLERRDEIIEPEEIPADSKRIGQEVTELLEYKPGELYIRRLIRPKYALPHGEGVVIGSLCVVAAAPHQCRAVAAGTVTRRQIPGSSAAAPSNWDSRPGGRTAQRY